MAILMYDLSVELFTNTVQKGSELRDNLFDVSALLTLASKGNWTQLERQTDRDVQTDR